MKSLKKKYTTVESKGGRICLAFVPKFSDFDCPLWRAIKVAKRDAFKLIFVLVVKLVNKFEFSCFPSKLNFPDKVPFSRLLKTFS